MTNKNKANRKIFICNKKLIFIHYSRNSLLYDFISHCYSFISYLLFSCEQTINKFLFNLKDEIRTIGKIE